MVLKLMNTDLHIRHRGNPSYCHMCTPSPYRGNFPCMLRVATMGHTSMGKCFSYGTLPLGGLGCWCNLGNSNCTHMGEAVLFGENVLPCLWPGIFATLFFLHMPGTLCGALLVHGGWGHIVTPQFGSPPL